MSPALHASTQAPRDIRVHRYNPRRGCRSRLEGNVIQVKDEEAPERSNLY